ncbi:MAG: putative C-S lyase [Bacteroidales bacterium]|jgi:cystathionine beta-lyase|nr:putative C-S lyase [Bacteroidales bacterium]
MYDFNKLIDRSNSDSFKWGAVEQRFKKPNLLPLWVADMDWETPDFVMDALKHRLEHPVLGYTLDPNDYWPAVIDWVQSHHNWSIKRDWLTYIPGVVKGIGFAINVFTNPSDKVIIQPPVYHLFRHVTNGLNRTLVNNPLKRVEGGLYEMDFENLERVADGAKLLVLSNPHNPGGVVWSPQVLERLAHFCYTHDIIVVSDEIHCDLVLSGYKHTPFATVSPEAEEISITLQAPTKTFNFAGIVSSYAIVPNEVLRKQYFRWLSAMELNEPNMFAPIATTAAFRKGEPWRKELLKAIESNIDYVADFCEHNIPQIKVLRPQASFLVWLDCRGLKLSHRQLVSLFVDKAGLALNDGALFGEEGAGYMRLNIGCPQQTIEEALTRLQKAIDNNS